MTDEPTPYEIQITYPAGIPIIEIYDISSVGSGLLIPRRVLRLPDEGSRNDVRAKELIKHFEALNPDAEVHTADHGEVAGLDEMECWFRSYFSRLFPHNPRGNEGRTKDTMFAIRARLEFPGQYV